jgi:hypothetical protein
MVLLKAVIEKEVQGTGKILDFFLSFFSLSLNDTI